MSKAYDQIARGLNEALAFANGDKAGAVVHKIMVDVPDVKAIRKATRLSQNKFAEVYMLNAENVKQWEQGRRQPDQAARVLLKLIAHNPKRIAKDLEEMRA